MVRSAAWIAVVASIIFSAAARTDAVLPSAVIDNAITSPVFECHDAAYQQFMHDNYVLFEVGQVHPLELSADGQWLYALNSPLSCLEIYRVDQDRLTLASSVTTGLQPVSVRIKNNHEIWVVNNLSDSISVIELAGQPRVTHILPVGDAPFDVAFAQQDKKGNPTRAFVSASARGQQHPSFDMHHLLSNLYAFEEHGKIHTEQLGGANIWVFDVKNSPMLEGIINPFMADVRSLAASADGNTVYAAGFLTGNQTTIASATEEQTSLEGISSETNSIIVKNDAGTWRSFEKNDHSNNVSITLPDTDIIAIDATRKPGEFKKFGGKIVPSVNRKLIKKSYSNVGTVIFSIAVDQNMLLATSLDSQNIIPRLENLQGIATKNQLILLNGNHRQVLSLDSLTASHTTHTSLPLPGTIHIGKDSIYVAGYGSSKVAVFNRNTLQKNINPSSVIDLQESDDNKLMGKGPSGLAETSTGTLIVLSRIDNSLHVIDMSNKAEPTTVQRIVLYTPESSDIVNGRRFLYDADDTGNGRVACASCHIFGDVDGLAWDLGSRKDKLLSNSEGNFLFMQDALFENMHNTVRRLPISANPFHYKIGDMIPVGETHLRFCFRGTADDLSTALKMNKWSNEPCAFYITEPASGTHEISYHISIMSNGNQWASYNAPHFNALKGPMTTQTLYGLSSGGAMHHRGDKTGNEPSTSNHCPTGLTREQRAFKEFNQPCNGEASSFITLLGGKALSDEDMDMFSRFALQMHFPPNPHRPFDNKVPAYWETLFSKDAVGIDFSLVSLGDTKNMRKGSAACGVCHTLDPAHGYFGSSHLYYSAPNVVSQDMDVPDFRTFYRKIGLFTDDYRNSRISGTPAEPVMQPKNQTTGFGFFHNGAFDGRAAFFMPQLFLFPDDSTDPNIEHPAIDAKNRINLFYFLSMFDTDVYPFAGQQRSLENLSETPSNNIAELSNTAFCKSYYFSGTNGTRIFHTDINKASKEQQNILATCYPKLHTEAQK